MSHLDFTLSLIDKLTRPLKTAQSSLTGFAEKSQASFTKIGIGAAAVWGVAQSIAGVVGPAYEMNAALAEVGSKGVAEDTLKRLSGEAMRFSMRYGKGVVDVVRSSYAMKGAMAGLSDLDLPRVTIAANTLAAGVKASGEDVDATGKMLPMGDILQKLQSKYGQSIEGNVKAQQALDAAFGGGADVIKKLYGQQDKLNRSITELGRNDGMKRAQEMAERMAEPWERIKATFFAIRVAIGNTLIPILSPLMNRIADVGTKFARWLDMFPNIARWLGYITLGVLSFGLAGAAVNIVMGVFGFTMMGLTAIAKVLGGAWKLLLWTLNMLRPSLLTTRIGLAALWIQSKLLALWTGVCRIALAAWNIALKAGAITMRIYGAATMFAGAAMQLLMSPITLIIAALALLAVGVWYVVTHWEKLAAAVMNTAGFAWVMSVAEQVGQVFAQVWQSITDGWAVVVDFFAALSPLAAFEGFAQTIGGVFSKLFDVLKNTFASTYNWIVEKLNKIPGVNIDLKTVSPPAAAAVPANAVIPDSAAGSSKLNSPSVLTGNRINADIPRGGLMSQVKTDSKTAVDNRKSWGDTYINAPNGITPAQLAEWQELNAG